MSNELIYTGTLLTAEEAEKIYLLMLYGRGERGASADDLKTAVAWAEGVRMDSGILDAVLQGSMLIDVNAEGETVFSLTEKGMQEGEAIYKEALAAGVIEPLP